MLKSLELFGFKSFADRTVFEFAEGVTCVVGPNGSGKSNVVDALKWILGDQSAKSLRGKEMSDVIFNGSAGRKASSLAEATLTFDNSSGLLPIETAEVQIGRRLYSSGDSEYLLNRNVVRLKDIREMFMGTGAGTAAYSIIEQGRVDQILQANPTTRRLVFEEAAGISRFKSRKVESQRRLERVDQNLLRLRDIVDQLESRLNATRSQASKAARYREYSTEYQRLWVGLAADDYRVATAQLDKLTAELQQINGHVESTDGELAVRDHHLSGFDARSTALDESIRDIERRRAAGRERIAGHEMAIRHQSTQQEELCVETSRLRAQRDTLRRGLRAVDEDVETTTRRLESIQNDFAQHKDALARREERINELRDRLQSAREAMQQQQQQHANLEAARTHIEQERSGLRLRLENAHSSQNESQRRAERLRSQLEGATVELEQRNNRVRQAEVKVAAEEARIEHARQERRQLQGEYAQSERQLALWREERSAKVARRQLLEDLESRNEGLSLGVREILSLAESSKQQPWSLVRGNVADLLQAELDDAPLLEVALGPRLQLLVIDDLRPMVEYLSTAVAEVSGRVGFVEAIAGDSGGTPPDRLLERPGVMGRADRLVSSCGIPGLAEQLLADTWVVETLDVAMSLAAGTGGGLRFVTLQGELLEADGTLFVGNASHETSVISRKSELRVLRHQIRSLQDRIEAEEDIQERLDSSLMETDGELADLQTALNSEMAELAARRSEATAHQAECERLKTSLEATEKEIEQRQTEQDTMERQLEESGKLLSQTDEKLAALLDTITRSQSLSAAIEAQLLEEQQSTKDDQLELAKHEERLSALQANHLRLAEDRRSRIVQVDQAQRQLQACHRKSWEITRAILSATSELAELFLADNALQSELRELLSQRNELRLQRRQLQQEQDRLRDRRRELADSIHALEMQSRDLRHTMATLIERIDDEFGMDLTECVDRGESAYQAWVAEESEPSKDDLQEHDTSSSTHQSEEREPDDEKESETSAGEAGVIRKTDDPRPSFEEVRDEIEDRVERLRRKIKNLGSVNSDSLQDLDELETRFSLLSGQLSDLEAAQSALEDIIRRINVESRRLFLETFESIRQHFQELYRKLFGGGEGDIVLEDPDDVLECGIDIVARPPGKELRSISLLSGGEKTMTAVALLFAMFKSKPSPYCILDEVDAALDEANVDRYVSVVKEFRESTQFVIITHRKRTMTAADQLYGVTMEQAGVSKRLNVEFEDVSEDGHFRTSPKAA